MFFGPIKVNLPNNGVINKQNNRFWASNNPHWALETNFQTVWGTNVW